MGRGVTATRMSRVLRALELPALVAVPAVMAACVIEDVDASALLTALAAVLAVGLMLAGVEASRPAMRQLMPTVVLAALAAAGRLLFAAVPDVKPVSAIAIVAGATLGPQSGFAVGALAALVSNLFFGQGAWTPRQMYAWGLVGYVAGFVWRGDGRASPSTCGASAPPSCTGPFSTASISSASYARSRGRPPSRPCSPRCPST